MGLALLGYGGLGLGRVAPRVPRRAEPVLGALAGLLNGAITAATGIFVLPSVPYLQALGLAREALIQALGLSFTVSTVAMAAALAGHGAFGPGVVGGSFAALAPALLGMAAGGWVRRRVAEATFRRWFFVGLVGLGAHLVWSG